MIEDRIAADLHLHTLASDGTCSIADRVEQATERQLDAVAITDHDRIADELDGRVEHRRGVDLITGVEVRADLADTKVELLGYYVDPAEGDLADVLERVRANRHRRNHEMLDRLERRAGIDIAYDSLQERADGIVGRPHFAAALVDRGVVDSIGEAFEEHLGVDGTAFVEMERLPHDEVLDAIHAAGGVAALAHPGRIRADRVEPLLDALVRSGLDGIEVWHPYGTIRSEAYADVDVDDAAAFASEFDLLATGGSDCHGPGSDKFRIGDVGVSADRLADLRTAAWARRPFNGVESPEASD